MRDEPSPLHLTDIQSASLREILQNSELVQAGAWMVGHFRQHPEGAINLPVRVAGTQDSCTDVRVPDWPYGENAEQTRWALDRFVAAELLARRGEHTCVRTELGELLIPVLPLYQVRNEDALDRRYPPLIDRVRGARVMDAGCGLGPFALQLDALGAREVIAVDYDSRHLDFTAALSHCVGARGILPLRASIEQLPLGDGCLDLVFCRVVLSFVHKHRVMAEFTRVLRRGGYMLLAMHAPRFFARRVWAGLLSRRRTVVTSGVRGLAGGLCFDLFGREPRWKTRSGTARMSYERPGTFRRYLETNGLELLSWEAGVPKPYVWLRKS